MRNGLNNTGGKMVTLERDDVLERLLMDAEMEGRIRGYVRKVLKEAGGEISSAAGSIMGNDPRNARRAVRHMVYKQLLGGNVSILQRRKAGNRAMVPPGNRGRSKRTEDLLSYEGADRGFILRFLNAGTEQRTAEGMNGQKIKRTERPKGGKREYKGPIGNRGRIAARNWFAGAAQKALESARDRLAKLIEDEINKINRKE